MVNKKFNHWVAKNGFKYREIKKLLGISESMISQLKSGKKRPGLELARKIEIVTGGKVKMESWIGL